MGDDWRPTPICASRLVDASAARMARWAELSVTCGLPELRFQVAPSWLEARLVALAATQALSDAVQSQQAHESACESARIALVKELQALGQNADEASLAALLLHADELVQRAVDARGQKKSLVKQMADAEQALIPLGQAAHSATVEMDIRFAQQPRQHPPHHPPKRCRR